MGANNGLEKQWEKYEGTDVNLSIFPEEMIKQGKTVIFPPHKIVVSRGEFPTYLYFIKSGRTVGSRDYADGNEYSYFQLDHRNGNIGLIEILAKKDKYIATVKSVTEMEALRIESEIVYRYIMENPEMLRRCITFVARDLYMRSGNDGILYYLDGLNRLRHYLLDYYETHKEQGRQIVVTAEYQDIARRLGVSIRTVGRSIRKLKDNKEIMSVNKKIVLTKESRELLFQNL